MEHLWTILKDERRYDGELRDHGEWGFEFRVMREAEFVYGVGGRYGACDRGSERTEGAVLARR
jgi:hypothetical protein